MEFIKDIGYWMVSHPEISTGIISIFCYNVLCNLLPNKYSRMLHEIVEKLIEMIRRRKTNEKDL